MRLISLNLGQALVLPGSRAQRPPKTGILKRPVTGSVPLTALGLAGDAVCSKRHHGGPDQAVYVYGTPDYAVWSALLGRDLAPGTFGENLTVCGLSCNDLAVGDRLRVGAVLLEVTAPRMPCATLAQHMGDAGFVKRFRDVALPGVYCRVIQTGLLVVGEAVQPVPHPGDRVGVLELFRDTFAPTRDVATIRRHLAAPLAQRLRQALEDRLARALSA